ncbi:hypothetical protein [Pseudooceanicola aestuarii]|uniref:hypothetical protein n=1 Tax=Pseudooceanicola aestuarii TaxID=2697319 RepID=UPI0013CFDB95|nr:hypothetical protein [Pseudooceanicola aestuarii]
MRSAVQTFRTLVTASVMLVGLAGAAQAVCYPIYYYYGWCYPTASDLCDSSWLQYGLCEEEEEEEEEDDGGLLDFTGVYHDIYIEDTGVFPETTFVALGDKIRFINVDADRLRMEARNSTWRTSRLSKGDEYAMLVLPTTYSKFRKDDSNSSRYDGEFRLQALPSEVDFGYIDASFINRLNLSIDRYIPGGD